MRIELTMPQWYCLGVYMRGNPSLGRAARFLRRHSQFKSQHATVGFMVGVFAAKKRQKQLLASHAFHYYCGNG